MIGAERRAAVAAYKERKSVAGIYGLRCTVTGQRWVGRALDLSTIENRVWFALRQGGHRSPTLQAAWREHGAAALVLEPLERLEDEALAYVRDRVLKQRLAHWSAELGAEIV